MRRTRSRSDLVTLGLVALAIVGVAGCGAHQGQAASGTPEPVRTAATPSAQQTQPAQPATKAPATRTPAPTIEPCALVSKQEAERLTRTPLDDAVAVRETCTYTGPVTGPTAQVEVYVGPGAKKFLDIERELGHELEPLAGIGDEAYAEDGTVFLNKAGVWVSIRLVLLNDPAENRKPMEDLARKVTTRL
ncbi:DUF3558 family protein [Actinopolymorpha alba]|uniref:DUF3558 family protein n=1 Tax=Actinopolymorpha alba TaxID=533267 RepID=UPI00037FA27E|nr:DUF3558 family protein [Actinopolymorpha alba]